MRHGNGYRKLGRVTSHRMMMLRNMATSFLTTGCVRTTVPRAKELRSIVEKIITLGKKGTLHARRQVEKRLFGNEAGKVVCTDLAVRFKDRPGGYTRILRFGPRPGDGAEMCQLELVDYQAKVTTTAKTTTTPTA